MEVEDSPNDLTDGELIGIRVILSEEMGHPYDERNVYYRAYKKLNDAAEKALENGVT